MDVVFLFVFKRNSKLFEIMNIYHDIYQENEKLKEFAEVVGDTAY